MDAQALTEAFRHGCFAVGLTGLGMVVLVACGIWLCRQARRLHASCQGQPVFRRLALLALVVLAFTVGGTKTNGVNNLPPQQRTLPQLQPTVLSWPSAPRLQGSLPEAGLELIASWTRTGAYSNEFVIDFPEGWCFPYETNHLESVALVARGEVFASEQAEDPLAALTTLLSIKPGTSEVVHGPTTNNSYRIEWHDGSRSRTVFDPADAAIELFRNGDIEITENGVTTRTPRTLPFAHDGYGQDAEWVAANFTNATEIAAAGGYPQWVDQQVGTGLTNGLYKLTVTVPDDPPETTQITVGNLSVAVTNAGEYVFLLEKGIRYPIMSFPSELDNVAYSVADDEVQTSLEPLRMMAGPVNSPRYSVHLYSQVEQSEAELVVPSRNGEGYVLYYPQLHVIPDDEYDPVFPVVLGAYVLDIPPGRDASYAWSGGGFSETGPYVLWFGNEDTDVIEVQAAYGDIVLNGWVVVERHVRENDLIISSGGAIVTEDCYTNAPGEVVAASSTVDRLGISWALAESGTIRLDASCSDVVALTEDSGGVQMPVSLPREWVCGADDEGNHEFLAAVTNFSATGNVGAFTLTFTPDDPASSTLTRTADLQVVKVRVEALADWPSNKVRHVFGPKEGFVVAATLPMDLLVSSNCHASISGGIVTAPDRCEQFSVILSGGKVIHQLNFQSIAPTGMLAGNPRELYAHEWHSLIGQPLSAGEAGVVMHCDTWLEPTYVSFHHLRLYEDFAPTSNRTGWYLDYEVFPEVLLQHGEAAGAGSGAANMNFGVSDVGNFTINGDFAGTWIGERSTYTNGSYQLDIPLRWFAIGGSTTNSLPDNVQTAWIYSNGTMRVQKNGITWERTIEGVSRQIIE